MAITKEIISNALLANEKYSSMTLSKLMRNTKDTLLKMFDEIGGDLNSLEPKKEKKTKLAKVDLAMTSDISSLGLTYSMVHYETFKIHNDKNIFEDVIDNLMIDEILSKDIKYRDDKDVLHTLTFGTEEHKKASLEFKADVLNPLNRAKKRLKILKFLSEQNSVYVNIINIIKKKESKFSYIKDVIRELREYVKVGETETKLFGEVMTPLELVKEMITTLPEETWSNPNLKILDPSNGCGPFPAFIIYKLMIGLTEWQPDEDLRYKHIIENMIYTCELQPKNMFLWLFTIDPKDEFQPNIYTGSFLDQGFDNHMKNVWGVDKFDIITGNPPYQDGKNKNRAHPLWVKFIEKSFSILNNSGYLNMVTPNSWITPNSKITSFFTESKLIVLNLDCKKYFKNVGSTFTAYLIKNEKNDINFLTKVVSNDISFLNIKGMSFIPSDFNPTTTNIVKKMLSNKKINLLSIGKPFRSDTEENVSLIKEDNFKYELFHTNTENYFSILEHPNQFTKKVIINKTGKWNPFYSETLGFTHINYGVEVSSSQEGKLLETYLNSKLILFYIKVMNVFGARDKFTIENIPSIQLINNIDDKYIYEYFSLAEQEINFIENYDI